MVKKENSRDKESTASSATQREGRDKKRRRTGPAASEAAQALDLSEAADADSLFGKLTDDLLQRVISLSQNLKDLGRGVRFYLEAWFASSWSACAQGRTRSPPANWRS